MIGLVTIVRDEREQLERCLFSPELLIEHWTKALSSRLDRWLQLWEADNNEE